MTTTINNVVKLFTKPVLPTNRCSYGFCTLFVTWSYYFMFECSLCSPRRKVLVQKYATLCLRYTILNVACYSFCWCCFGHNVVRMCRYTCHFIYILCITRTNDYKPKSMHIIHRSIDQYDQWIILQDQIQGAFEKY